jgi:hypothetical protein
MAIDQMPNFAAGPPNYGGPPQAAPNPYGAPPPQQPGAFGAPGGAQPGFPPPQGGPPGGGFGAPADQGYGAPAPQQQYGAPPAQQPYGAPPGQQPYGAPPGQQQQGYGGPTGQELAQGANQFGAAASSALAAGFNAQPGAGPSQRNPVKTLIIAYGVLFGVNIVGSIIVSILARIVPALGFLGTLISIGAFIAYGFMLKPMLLETMTAANNQDLKWWWQLVPFLNCYFDWLKIPELVTAAKTQRGILQQKPTRTIVFYVFLFPYALALDLNDLAPPGQPPA